jgi:hypothetical protein
LPEHKEESCYVINLKTLAIAAAALSSVVLAMPASSHAVLQAAPVKIDAASNGNLVQVDYRRYCRHGRCDARYHRYREYQRSYYDLCPPNYGYYMPYYGSDRPCKSHYRPDYRYRYYPYFSHSRGPWLEF